jgi:oxygen-dependent protoporphyrinogen oxidase
LSGSARRVLVVGGGIGGLAAAWEAQEHARELGITIDVTLVEAKDRVGGSIISEPVGDCLVEGGPDCFVSEKPGGIQLARDLGLEQHLAPTNEGARKSYVLWKGALHPLPDGLILLVPTQIVPFVTSSLFSWPGKARMGMDLVLPRGKDRGDETLGDFIRRRFGSEALEKLGEPLVAGIHSGDPETMSVQATFPRFLQMEREERTLILAMLRRMKAARAAQAAAERDAKVGKAHTLFVTLDRGVRLFVDELERRLGAATILKGDGARSLSREGEGAWRLSTASGRSVEADAVILAAPAYVAAELLQRTAPDAAKDLQAIPYVSSATVTLAYRRAEFPAQPNGFGAVIPKGEHRRIKAFTWVTTKFFERAPEDTVLMRCFLRATTGSSVGLSDEEMVTAAREELSSILGVAATPLWTRSYRWDRAMPQYVVGHLDRVARIEAALGALPRLVLAGGAYRGSGIPDTVRLSRERARALVDSLAASVAP